MDKHQLISEAKRLVGNAEIEKALSQVLAFLGSEAAYRHLYQEALLIQSQFKKAQRDESLGLASNEQAKLSYSQTAQWLLRLLDRLESGDLAPADSGEVPRKNKLVPILAGALAVAAAIIAVWLFLPPSSGAPPEEPQQQSDTACPTWPEEQAFNILLFPFQPLNDNTLRPHIAISNRLAQLKEKYGINCGIRFYEVNEADPNSYPATSSDAGNIGSRCQAKLAIWGTAESIPNSAIIRTNYKFLHGQGQLPLHKLMLTEKSGVDTVTTISSIATEGRLTQDIEESILLLFGLIAHESGNRDIAIELLESYPAADSASALLRGMVLADNYFSTHQEEKAVKSYDEVLALHPDYFLARNNRGILYFNKGLYAEAAEDLTVALQKDSNNAQLLEIRGDAFLRTEQLNRAKEDYLRAREISPATRTSEQKIKEVDRKIEEQRVIKERADLILRSNPTNLPALMQQAEASQKLGEYSQAIKAAETILRREPQNIKAFAQLIQAYHNQGDTAQIAKTLERAKAAGIRREKLNELTPVNLNRSFLLRPVQRK